VRRGSRATWGCATSLPPPPAARTPVPAAVTSRAEIEDLTGSAESAAGRTTDKTSMTVPSSEADPTVGCPSTRREPLTSSEVRFPDHTNRLPSDSDPAFCDTPRALFGSAQPGRVHRGQRSADPTSGTSVECGWCSSHRPPVAHARTRTRDHPHRVRDAPLGTWARLLMDAEGGSLVQDVWGEAGRAFVAS